MSTPARIHGGTDALGAARFDFSTNSNACGPCPAALAAVQAADATRYPDADYTQLRQRLAELHGVERWRIVLAGSASEFIFRISAWVRQCGHSRFWTPAQAYGDYAHAADAWSLLRSDTLQEADLVWACEPASPSGCNHADWPLQLLQTPVPGVRQAGPRDIAGAARPTDAVHHTAAGAHQTVVLDCAYAPLRLSGQPSLNATQADQVWRLYSPNKALTLTGIRAAYAIAPAQGRAAAHQLEAMAPSWVVGVHGEAMLLAWTTDAVQTWLGLCLPTLAAWKAQQVAMLQDLGWQCLPSEANFFCALPPASTDVPRLLHHLRSQGIKLRDATSLGLSGHVRLSAQPPEAQQALRAAFTAFERLADAQPSSGFAPFTLETSQ